MLSLQRKKSSDSKKGEVELTMKKLAKGLVGLGIVAAGCGAIEADDSIFFEETVRRNADEDMHQEVVVLESGGKPYFNARLKHFENLDLLEYSARGNFGFGAFNGTAELVGFEDSDNNSGAGVNGRGNSGENTLVGFALEKRVDAGTPTQMSNLYARHAFEKSWGDFELTAAVGDLDGDTIWAAALDILCGNDFYGAGVFADDDGEGYATAVAGRFTEQKGEGFGYRVWGKSTLDGENHLVDFTASTRTNFVEGMIRAPIKPDNGMLDPKLMDNRFDAHLYPWNFGNGIIANARHLDIAGVETRSADFMHHWKYKGSFLRLGAGYSRIDDGTDAVEAGRINLGAIFKKGYIDVIVEQTSEGDTNVEAVAGAGVTF